MTAALRRDDADLGGAVYAVAHAEALHNPRTDPFERANISNTYWDWFAHKGYMIMATSHRGEVPAAVQGFPHSRRRASRSIRRWRRWKLPSA